MLGRLVLGLVKGLLVGAAVFAALHYGLGIVALVGWQLYAVVMVAGAITGLVAGRAIWQRDAKIEAGLKAVFGGILAPAALWAALKWAPIPAIAKTGVPEGQTGLTAWSVAAFTLVVALLFELDNTPAPEEKAGPKSRVEPKLRAGSRSRVAEDLDEEELEAPAPSRRAKR